MEPSLLLYGKTLKKEFNRDQLLCYRNIVPPLFIPYD